MKTGTRSKILKIVEKHGKVRPYELRSLLNISAQAVHRHLKSMVEQGLVEVRGTAPYTQYALAGVPDLDGVSAWINARTPAGPPPSPVCETRDAFAARLPSLASFVKAGLPPGVLPLVISTAGEIGNNSFDHNLGQWRDVPGCWFEPQISGRRLWICIADRGQGVFQSLAKVHPHLTDDQSALTAAFETIISGRAPERRGNGLKYVRGIVSAAAGGGLACLSGSGRVRYGEQGERCLALLAGRFTAAPGAVTLMTWRLP